MGDSQQSNEGEVSSVEPTEVSVTPPEEGKEQQQVDEFAKLLESELPIPEVPTTDTNSPLPSPDALNRYRTALYNYYIQYYARHYIKQLRNAIEGDHVGKVFGACGVGEYVWTYAWDRRICVYHAEVRVRVCTSR